jgi:hypothetical protein
MAKMTKKQTLTQGEVAPKAVGSCPTNLDWAETGSASTWLTKRGEQVRNGEDLFLDGQVE